MRLPIRLTIAAVLSLAGGAVLAQDNAVVLFDATRKNSACMVADVTKDSSVPPNQPICVDDGKPLPFFLVQGQRNQLRVIKRKFLTRYAFFVDKVTQSRISRSRASTKPPT